MADSPLYILDTDHISLLQRGSENVWRRLITVAATQRAVTVITVAEQVQGRLAVIGRAKSEQDAARGFSRLSEAITFYQSVRVLAYDDAAVDIYVGLRQQKIRIGTQDLRIAAIALAHHAIVVTRNLRDFHQVPLLSIIDWSTN